MKRILAGTIRGALLFSSLAGAESYQFQQRISGLQQALENPPPNTSRIGEAGFIVTPYPQAHSSQRA